MSDNLSVILIQIDSLNRHFLAGYGHDWVQAPNLAAFAEKAAVFDNHFVSSLPCMPARREIWAGTQEFWWRGWRPLEPYTPWSHYGRIDQGATALDAEEVAWLRAQFAGKLTMVDRWLGRVFERLDRYRLWERTCVIITTDHGHYLGDHGWMGKPNAPLYHTLCHIPLLVWHPGGAHNGRRISAMTQTLDLYATVLDLLGLEVPTAEHVHSQSFAPILLGQRDTHRDYAVYAYHQHRVGITAGEWTL